MFCDAGAVDISFRGKLAISLAVSHGEGKGKTEFCGRCGKGGKTNKTWG